MRHQYTTRHSLAPNRLTRVRWAWAEWRTRYAVELDATKAGLAVGVLAIVAMFLAGIL